MQPISFMSANFVARQLGYQMTEGWMQGDEATNAYFQPLETFRERFDAMLGEVAAMGFEAIDIWIAHLNPAWATADHIAVARDCLAARDLTVTSMAGWYGDTPEGVEQYCRLTTALGARIIGGNVPLVETDRVAVVEILNRHGVRLGLENHPERSAAELLARIGVGGPIGACVDTGWWGTQGVDAAEALAELAPVLVHVHLKDIRASGAHETCALGDGVVPVRACVAVLRRAGYRGPLSIEHEPESYDPTVEVVESRKRLEQWIAEESK